MRQSNQAPNLPFAFPLSLLSLFSTGVDSVTVTVAAKFEFSSPPLDAGASDSWRLGLEAEDEGRVTRKPLRNNGTIEMVISALCDVIVGRE